jgi:hypothetical protein
MSTTSTLDHTLNPTGHCHLDNVDSPEAISGRQCPTCRSWETRRHVEGFRVWFTCDTCGCVFN